MTLRGLISKIPVLGGAVAKSMGWQNAMFGDLLGGASGKTGDLVRPYARSAWVRAAIDFVADPISMRPLIITADRRGGDVLVTDLELVNFLERPGRCRGGVLNRADFIKATAGWMKLKGQAFWILDDTWETTRVRKSPLILARPDEMHAIYDGKELIGWTWTNAGGMRANLIPEQVIHLKLWNPYDDVLGLSEWESAMIAAESDYAAGVFAKSLAQNNGDRGPYVIGKGGMFTDEQIKQVSAQLRQKRELGRAGDFRASFIPADVDIKEPSINAVDAAYVSQRLENRKEVFTAFGVPASFADAQASYSIGSASDRFRLIEDTCMPLSAKIADAFEIVCTKFLGKRQTVFVEFDWDSHSTMQAVRSERFDIATKAVDRGMPWHEASEYFKLKLPRFPGDDVGRVPFNLQEIGVSGSGMEDPTAPTDPVDPLAELSQLFASQKQAPCGCTAKAPQPAGVENEKWLKIHRTRAPWEKKFQQKISRYLMDARAETLRKIAAAGAAEKSVTRAFDVLALIFDAAAFLETWTKGLLGLSRAALEQAGAEVWTEELGKSDTYTQPAAEVLTALSERENRIRNAGTQVFEAIQSTLQEGINGGETTEQLAERVRKAFQGIDKSRSLMIAKTETTVAYETARDMAFRAAGVQWKQWLTSGLGNTRLSHLNANEQIVPMDEAFKVGGHALRFPGDPNGPPQEVINCNCVCIAVAGPEGDIMGNNPDSEIPY